VSRNGTKSPFPALLREDGRRVELICPHGIGHPVQELSHGWRKGDDVHGCDGCCTTAAFGVEVLEQMKKRRTTRKTKR